MKLINPATDEVLKEVETDDIESIKSKVADLRTGLVEWKNTKVSRRVECIKKFSDLLKEEFEKLAMDLCLETGKPLSEAKGEIKGSIGKLKFFLEQSSDVLESSSVHDDGTTKEVLSYDPLGVVCNISAWNYPYLVGINTFIPALICGNSVIYKPSEFATLTGLNIERLLHKAGVPNNVFKAVVGAGDVGQILLEQKLDGYFFTGSYKTGRLIATTVAPTLVPVGLELGGNDPLYVTDEIADIKLAAESAVEGAFYNNGQSCCSVERIYIHEKVYDDFCSHFIETVKGLKVGDPLDSSITQGAITRKAHLSVLSEQVTNATKLGAKVETGGSIIERNGSFFEPTVLTNVTHEMKVMRDESFGPVIGLMKVGSDEEAISLMNDTEYGLTSAVFTNNEKRGKNILSQINSGTGYLNCCDRVSGYLPWSGRGHSGLGSALSKHGLYAFCNPKGYHLR